VSARQFRVDVEELQRLLLELLAAYRERETLREEQREAEIREFVGAPWRSGPLISGCRDLLVALDRERGDDVNDAEQREIYCETCGDFQPLDDEGGPHSDDLNEHPWHDLVCGTCRFVIATIRVRAKGEA
jgi:hypothetical protein